MAVAGDAVLEWSSPGRAVVRGPIAELPRQIPPGTCVLAFDPVADLPRIVDLLRVRRAHRRPAWAVKTRHSRTAVVTELYAADAGVVALRPPGLRQLAASLIGAPAWDSRYSYDVGWWYAFAANTCWQPDRTVLCKSAEPVLRRRVCELARKFGASFVPSYGRVWLGLHYFQGALPIPLRLGETMPRSPQPLPDELLDYGSREALVGTLAGLCDAEHCGFRPWNHNDMCNVDMFLFGLADDAVREQWQRLLRRLGVSSFLHRDLGRIYLAAGARDIRTVIREVRCVDPLVKANIAVGAARTTGRTQYDLIPVSQPLRRALLRGGGKRFCGRTWRYAPSRPRCQRWLDALAGEEIDHPEFEAFCQRVGSRLVGWDVITEAVEVEAGPLYELVVADGCRAVLANGLVV